MMVSKRNLLFQGLIFFRFHVEDAGVYIQIHESSKTVLTHDQSFDAQVEVSSVLGFDSFQILLQILIHLRHVVHVEDHQSRVDKIGLSYHTSYFHGKIYHFQLIDQKSESEFELKTII